MQPSSDRPTTLDPDQHVAERRRHTMATIAALEEVIDAAKLTLLSNKSSEEVTKLQQEIAEIVPVGNVAGLVLSGLVQLKDRVITADRAQRDIEALMRGIDVLRRAFFGAAFFASPAAILSAYQKMLALTGKDVDSAFPDGLWQFYLEFSMREDVARHTNETYGFQQSLAHYELSLSLPDQLTAWAAAVINLHFQYDDLLMVEWAERVYLGLLEAEAKTVGVDQNSFFKNLRKKWNQQKPFRRESDAKPTETYAQYRRRKFQTFCVPRLQSLPAEYRQKIDQTYQAQLETQAPRYQDQLSILTTLDPEPYKESRRAIPLWQARLAIIWQDEYHLIPVCAINSQGEPLCFSLSSSPTPAVPLSVDKRGQLIHPIHHVVTVRRDGLILSQKEAEPVGRLQPLPFQQLSPWIAAITNGNYRSNSQATEFDLDLLQIPRREQPKARRKLSATAAANLEVLKMASIIINWDEREAGQPLGLARLGRRGVGDHALTIFRTSASMIFDQSHIFFDGIWGLSLVEILTNEAISWAGYLAQNPSPPTAGLKPATITGGFHQVTLEAAVESSAADARTMAEFRQHLAQRSRDIVFTINDLLILYRTLFNREYQPSQALKTEVNSLELLHETLAEEIRQAWRKLATVNPALLIPMDAGERPRDRLYPVTFRNPFPEFLDLFDQTYNALKDHRQAATITSWSTFNHLRSKLIRELFYFGQLMVVHKALTAEGRNASITSLKLLGHLPGALQIFLDKIPQKLDFVNEMLKGEEVFSNVGHVPRGTSPRRFISARDDNDAKTMVWGVLTDDDNIMHISLRDFRPEVTALFDVGRADLAQMMAQDFLDDFVRRLNLFVFKLNDIAEATVEETE